jgi:hypothetical protein
VSAFNAELRQCLEIVLGTAPPEPDCEPLVFFRQWLAERNLAWSRSRTRASSIGPVTGSPEFEPLMAITQS